MNLLASTLATAFLAPALVSSAAPPPEPTPRPLVSSVEVSVTNIDVVVTDSKGNRVRDLKKEDFVVLEDGKVQDLSNFLFVDDGFPATSEPREPGEAPPRPQPGILTPTASTPQARIAVFVDNLHLSPLNRNAVLSALDEFLRRAVGPNVEATIVTYDRSLKARGPFTRDAEVLSRVIQQIKGESSTGFSRLAERNQAYKAIDRYIASIAGDPVSTDSYRSQAEWQMQLFAQHEADMVEGTINALKVTISRMAGIEGRKILLLVSEKLPEIPGIDVYEYYGNALRGAGIGNVPEVAQPTTYARWDQTQNFRAVAAAANSAFVSLNTFDAAGMDFDPSLSADSALTTQRVDTGVAKLSAETMLRLLADETGGVAAIQRNDFPAVLVEMERDWKTYYSLGYPSQPKKGDKPRSITVRLKQPGLTVRARHQVVDLSAEQRLQEQVVSGLFFQNDQNPLEAQIEIGQLVKGEKKAYVLPLTLRVPYAKLTLVPDRGTLKGGLVFTAAVKGPDGRTTKPQSTRIAIDVPESAAAPGTSTDLVWQTTFAVQPGDQVFSIAVTDEISRATSFVQPVFTLASRKSDTKKADASPK
jgi:VWFA-related protein